MGTALRGNVRAGSVTRWLRSRRAGGRSGGSDHLRGRRSRGRHDGAGRRRDGDRRAGAHPYRRDAASPAASKDRGGRGADSGLPERDLGRRVLVLRQRPVRLGGRSLRRGASELCLRASAMGFLRQHLVVRAWLLSAVGRVRRLWLLPTVVLVPPVLSSVLPRASSGAGAQVCSAAADDRSPDAGCAHA